MAAVMMAYLPADGQPKLACERRLEMTFEESSSRTGF
jgi:hypothetical protein